MKEKELSIGVNWRRRGALGEIESYCWNREILALATEKVRFVS
jgi:hypothetical protein